MRWRAFKFFACLVLAVQVMTSMAFGEGLTLCVPSVGNAHVEGACQPQQCNQDPLDSADSGLLKVSQKTGCVDVPVGGPELTTANGFQHDEKPAHPERLLAAVPAFIQTALSPQALSQRSLVAIDEAIRPDDALASLGCIILII